MDFTLHLAPEVVSSISTTIGFTAAVVAAAYILVALIRA